MVDCRWSIEIDSGSKMGNIEAEIMSTGRKFSLKNHSNLLSLNIIDLQTYPSKIDHRQSKIDNLFSWIWETIT